MNDRGGLTDTDGSRPTRRSLLAATTAVGAGGLTGCGNLLGGGDTSDPNACPGDVTVAWDADTDDSVSYRWSNPPSSAATPASPPDPPITERWRVSEADLRNQSGVDYQPSIDSYLPFSVDQQTVFVVSDVGLHALDATAGDIRWTKELWWSLPAHWPPIVNGSTVLTAGTGEEQFVAVDTTTREVSWRRQLDSITGTGPIPASDRIVAPTSEGLLALDPADGTTAWGPVGIGETTPSTPTMTASNVCAVGGSEVAALDPATGAVDWRRQLALPSASTGEFHVEPWVVSDSERVYCFRGYQPLRGPGERTDEPGEDYSASVVALSAATGEQQWTYSVPGAHELHGVAVDGTVFVGGERISSTGTGPDTTSPPEDAVGPSSSLVAIDAIEGCRRWRVEPFEPGFSPDDMLVLADQTLVARSVNGTPGRLYGVSVTDGSVRWEHSLDHTTETSPPLVGDGTLYIAQERDSDTHIVALE